MLLDNIVNRILIRFAKIQIIEKSDLFDKNWYSLEYDVDINEAANHYLEVGWLNGNDPSEFFSTSDYLECNPDTKVMNPLVHYETYGKVENRILTIRPKTKKKLSNENYVNGCKFIYENSIEKNKKNIAIFAAYSKSEKIPNYVVYTLKKLSEEVDDIIYISDNYLKDTKEINKIKDYVSYAEFDRHNSYDYGSWKKGIEYLRNKGIYDTIDRLYLINDSQYGPIKSFKEVFEKMNNSNYDFWGLTDSDDSRYHLVSFFLCFTNKVFTDDIFLNHISRIKPNMEYLDIVFNIERKFTSVLQQKYKCGCYSKDFCKNSREVFAGNSFAMLWQTSMVENGFPYIKVKSLDGTWKKENASYEDTNKALKYISEVNQELYELIIEDLNERNSNIKELTNDFYNKVKNKKCVSFDIFDTLIIRPFKEPEDVFDYIESKYKLEGFSRERQIAQKRANIDYDFKKQITLDDIYKHIIPRFRDVKELEIMEEKNICEANPMIEDIYHYCVKMGIKIIAISDMYLPKEVIKNILTKNGFSKIEEIFISSDVNKGKNKSELYHYVLNKLKLKSNEIIHIGDNEILDIKYSSELGIDAFKQNNPITHMFKSAGMTKFKIYSENNKSLAISAYMQAIAKHFSKFNKNENYFYELGYVLCGPLALSFLTFIKKKTEENNIDKILFVARDGYLLKDIYDKFFYKETKIDSDYVYLTRASVLSATLDFNDNYGYLKSILDIYNMRTGSNLLVSNSSNINMRTFQKHYKDISEWANSNYKNLKKHLENKTNGFDRIAIVDMTTADFTSMRGAKKILSNKVQLGLYTCVLNTDSTYPFECMTSVLDYVPGSRELSLSEILITSPEKPIIGVKNDGKPIYDVNNKENRVERYNNIYDGAVNFITDFTNKFGLEDYVQLSMQEWTLLAKDFLKYSTLTDEKYLKDLVLNFLPIGSSEKDISFLDSNE